MSNRIAIVGATGAVGQEMLRVLEQRKFPVSELIPLASRKSVGAHIRFREAEIPLQALEDFHFEGVDLALFSIGEALARAHAPRAVAAGAWVVDNSTAFRMNPDVPLVVPEVNGSQLDRLQGRGGIIANPNCCAIPLVVTLHALRSLSAIRRVVVTTFQSVSGTGKDAMEELEVQVRAHLEGREAVPTVYPRPIAFNCFPHVGSIGDNGYAEEEMKLRDESRKILGQPGLAMSATCVRVPVLRSHCESVMVEFDRAVSEGEARAALGRGEGLEVWDQSGYGYPTPLDATGKDTTLVGRIRDDLSLPGAVTYWLASDNLRKGAALNAVQIAERLPAPVGSIPPR